MPTRENDLEQTQTSKGGETYTVYSATRTKSNFEINISFFFPFFKSKIMRCKEKNWGVSIPSKKKKTTEIIGRSKYWVAFLVYIVSSMITSSYPIRHGINITHSTVGCVVSTSLIRFPSSSFRIIQTVTRVGKGVVVDQ
jgi:hypothetical protein